MLHLIVKRLRIIFDYSKIFTLLFFCLGIFLNSYGQDNSDSLKVELDPIKVTAIQSTISSANAPLSLTTFSRDLASVNHSSSMSLKSVGDQLPGLWINDRQNYALGERLTIRGIGWRAAFGVRGIQVVLNGIPLTVADGQTMINVIEPAFIRRAELVRGPAATYWGNSSGGVLYLSTTPSYQESSNVRLRTMAGSFGMRKAEAEWSISNPNHRMTAYSSYLKSDGFRDHSGVKMLRSGLTGSITLSPQSQLKYQAGAIYMPKAQHPSSLTKQQAQTTPTMARPSFRSAAAGKTITQGQAGLSYILDTSAGILNVTGYGIYRDLSNPLPFGIITVNRWAGGLRTTLDKSWDNIDLQVGIESKLQNDDRTEFENAGNARRGAVTVDQVERVWNQGIFATSTFSFGDVNISGGLRFDRLTFTTDTATAGQTGSRTFQAFSPSLGLSYTLDNQTLFANLSTSFEAPTTTELVNRPSGGNGFNPNLKPEQTIGLEVGARGTVAQQALQFDFAAYKLWITDLLFPYQLNPNGPTFYRNQGETNHIGIEGRFSWHISNNWELSSTANISEATFEKAQILDSSTQDTVSLAGKNIPGIPDLRVNSELRWSPGTFTGTLSYEYISSYTTDNRNTASNDQYGLFDISFSYRTTLNDQSVHLQPFINVKNILDTRYNGSVVVNASGGRYFEPAPGRNWQMGISVDF